MCKIQWILVCSQNCAISQHILEYFRQLQKKPRPCQQSSARPHLSLPSPQPSLIPLLSPCSSLPLSSSFSLLPAVEFPPIQQTKAVTFQTKYRTIFLIFFSSKEKIGGTSWFLWVIFSFKDDPIPEGFVS